MILQALEVWVRADVAGHLDTLSDRLVGAALRDVATLGFAGLTLRTIAAQADCTTGAIVQRFGNRDGLLRSACARALDLEIAFHRDLDATVDAIVQSPLTTADLVVHYILAHSQRDEARLFLWAAVTDGGAPLAEWHRIRREFWEGALGRAGLPVERAETLVSYILMEEYYATALAGDTTYALLLPETVRTFLRFTDPAAAARPSLAGAIDEQPRSLDPGPVSDAPVRSRLVRSAADEILSHGVEALNQRRAARIAHASPSAITYHFGDMERFINEAIWSALLRDIPRELDPTDTLDGHLLTIEQWLARLVGFLRPRADGSAAGFYTNFARITGQMCLLVATRPPLDPLARHLRALEGWGTYRASRHLTGPGLAIRRDHAAAFAIWIKGEAILRGSGGIGSPITAAMLVEGARAIFPPV